jgi:hypothetical protein
MKYTDYQNSGKRFRSLTGLSCEQWRALFPCIEEARNEYLTNYDMDGNIRNGRRSFTVCRNRPLPAVADRLFFIPVYLKNNPLQEYHAACFRMDQKHGSSFIHVLHRIPEQCLRDADAMPAEIRKGTSHNFRIIINPWHYKNEFT